jgi:hypothetical protein
LSKVVLIDYPAPELPHYYLTFFFPTHFYLTDSIVKKKKILSLLEIMYLPRVEVEGSLYNVVVPGATADAFFWGFWQGLG